MNMVSTVKPLTFYVYHKVKGDRMGGPDYELLSTHPSIELANRDADLRRKSIKQNGFHSIVVRIRRVIEDS